MNPKEHLWSRLKAVQLYESANIFLMLYNADDRDSFEKLNSIHHDFRDSNNLGAYQMLISIVTKDVQNKLSKKVVTQKEVKALMHEKGIPSFIEVSLETKKNFEILDFHLRFIMNPNFGQ